jgi:hypothetical protein
MVALRSVSTFVNLQFGGRHLLRVIPLNDILHNDYSLSCVNSTVFHTKMWVRFHHIGQ